MQTKGARVESRSQDGNRKQPILEVRQRTRSRGADASDGSYRRGWSRARDRARARSALRCWYERTKGSDRHP